MNAQMQATWRKMVGAALLWVALAALAYIPSSAAEQRTVIIATCLGFVAFCFGVALLADGLKRDIVEQLRRERSS